MENASPARIWLRRLVIAASCLPLAAVTILHRMGRADEYGLLGEWYVMVPLTVAGVLGWMLIEKAIAWAVDRPSAADPTPEPSERVG
ncbi:hypothetical protein [Actinoplanes solisilvae]|uniref:hypothetical protein n=1 Tax=Actinoplanes solisilvae TaxID=2486853 RepID=UPI000FD772AD|nr:hypothetical protein [Actinoplanes solisilvae]